MPQMAPMLWMFWMGLFWIVTLVFMLVNYFSSNLLSNKVPLQSNFQPKVNYNRVFADILNKLMNE